MAGSRASPLRTGCSIGPAPAPSPARFTLFALLWLLALRVHAVVGSLGTVLILVQPPRMMVYFRVYMDCSIIGKVCMDVELPRQDWDIVVIVPTLDDVLTDFGQ